MAILMVTKARPRLHTPTMGGLILHAVTLSSLSWPAWPHSPACLSLLVSSASEHRACSGKIPFEYPGSVHTGGVGYHPPPATLERDVDKSRWMADHTFKPAVPSGKMIGAAALPGSAPSCPSTAPSCPSAHQTRKLRVPFGPLGDRALDARSGEPPRGCRAVLHPEPCSIQSRACSPSRPPSLYYLSKFSCPLLCSSPHHPVAHIRSLTEATSLAYRAIPTSPASMITGCEPTLPFAGTDPNDPAADKYAERLAASHA